MSNIKRVIADLLIFDFSTRILSGEFFRVSFMLDFSLQIFSIVFKSGAFSSVKLYKDFSSFTISENTNEFS